MAKPKVSELLKSIKETRGNISAIARAYGRSRKSVYDWIETSQTLKDALEDARRGMVDEAINLLYEEIQEKNLGAAFYVMNNAPYAKQLGWGAKTQIEHSGSLDVRNLSDDELRAIVES
jgi:transposase